MFFAIPFPNVDPIALEIGPLVVRWYGLAYVVGILLGWWYARSLVGSPSLWGPAGPPIARREVNDIVVYGAVGVLLGGRIGYVLFYDPAFYLADPVEILAVWRGGMSFHGGLLGVLLAMTVFARVRRRPLLLLMDVVAASAPIGLLLGRLANFVNGELYGRVTDVSWAMVFPEGGTEPRHPSQLYEAALEGVALFIVLRVLTNRYGKLANPGFVTGAFAAGYGVARITAEFFREPDIQIGYLAGGLTMGMLLSIPLILLGLGLMIWSSQRSRTTSSHNPAGTPVSN